jgi:ATP-dependent Clp protease ATP-binding subunit ClpB
MEEWEMGPFDQNVMNALAIAEVEAKKRHHTEVSPYHLAYGFVLSHGSRLRNILEPHTKAIETRLEQFARSAYESESRLSKDLSMWIKEATAHSAKEGSSEVGERHFLKDIGTYLKDLGISQKDIGEQSQAQEEDVPDFLMDLSAAASSGKLDPVIGRTKEIRAVMEILGRRSKNNPVLVGPAGVGKTAIVEGLAGEIVKNRVPDVLKGKTIYSLDMGSLMAGTKFRGEFEERLQKLLKFIKSKNGEAILFIDEIHQLVGAGRTDGAMDAANLLKPALARGELHCIGATTPEEFQKYILKDAALERRFRPVNVDEPSKEDAIEIMMGVRDKLESHHGIKISDEAIYASVLLSIQYLSGKQLPDKSIDLIDEAASSLKLSAEAMPAELEQLSAEIRSKKILAKVEKNNAQIEEDIRSLEQHFEQGRKIWEESVQNIRKHASMQNQLERSRFELETAERSGDYETASRLKYAVIPDLEKELKESENGSVLSEADVAAVITRQTGIPLEKILRSKQDKILGLYDFLNNRVYGQENALKEIADTLMTSYAGLGAANRPLGSFLLKGPTGVEVIDGHSLQSGAG